MNLNTHTHTHLLANLSIVKGLYLSIHPIIITEQFKIANEILVATFKWTDI